MKSLIMTLNKMLQGLYQAVMRFPLTVFCLLSSTALTCYMISLHRTPELIVQKLMFVFLLGSFIGVTAQFACERFWCSAKQRLGVYGLAVLLTLLYYFSIASLPMLGFAVVARTIVAVFAMFCLYIWLPSYQSGTDFNTVALIHFKSALTSLLYAGVLSAGLAALIAAIDILFFRVDGDVYGYMLAIVWLLFATLNYLARLPRFHADERKEQAYLAEASLFPRVLEILVAQIAIPLIAAYTLVLLSYFIKIGITGKWPIGQLGPMILGYAAAGWLLFILASRLGSRIAVLYQRLFPKVLIPIVVMQLISVYIRLRAYGVTESRYYVALFGVFSLVVGGILTIRPKTKNGIIALLAAAFAIISVVPPVDAFTVSRNSQVARLEQMLQSAGVLVAGQLEAKTDVDFKVRLETTNILNYLQQRGYLSQVAWLPENFSPYRDMQNALGFGPTYGHTPDVGEYFNANLGSQALAVSGYDALLQVGTYRQQEDVSHAFTVNNREYQLVLRRTSPMEAQVVVQDAAGVEIISTGLQDFAMALKDKGIPEKEMLGAEQLTLEVANEKCKLRIVFQNISATFCDSINAGIDYSMFVMVAIAP